MKLESIAGLRWPATPTERHGDIKVQLSTSTDGRTLLVCDASD